MDKAGNTVDSVGVKTENGAPCPLRICAETVRARFGADVEAEIVELTFSDADFSEGAD